MRSNDYKIFDEGLLNEMLSFADDKSLEIKVNRIYYKALRARKIALCDRIQEKYPQYLKKLDSVLAFGYALIAQKKN